MLAIAAQRVAEPSTAGPMEAPLAVLNCLVMRRRTRPSPFQPESPFRVRPINGGYRKPHDSCGTNDRRPTHLNRTSLSDVGWATATVYLGITDASPAAPPDQITSSDVVGH